MFVIAELGSNWKTVEDCFRAVNEAKLAGANAIKFQLFTHQELYGYEGNLSVELNKSWIPYIAMHCKKVRIEFMCTPFSLEGLKFIDPFVKRHKIASSDMGYTDLIDAAIRTNKNVIISTGGHTLEEVKELPKSDKITLLYCESVYPSYAHDLRKMELLKYFNHPVGFSDHSLDVYGAPLEAQSKGATILEKHFNPMGYTDTPDSPHSLGIIDFWNMVKAIRGQTPKDIYSPEEADMVNYHNRRDTPYGFYRLKKG